MKAIFMMGGPGSGKSYVRGKLFGGVAVLDCDSLKEAHPAYDPKNPSALHEWSRQELSRAFFRQIGSGEDFIYDGTGSDAGKYVHLIRQAQEAGYEVEIVYVTCSLKTALKRNATRSRVVPESIVRDKHATIATSFEIVSRYSDTVRVVNND
jgi:predicted kinase